MPLIETSTYKKAPFWQINGHFQTIFPAFRTVKGIDFDYERLTLPDGDFVDLAWVRQNSAQLVILIQGLEGHAERPYMRGMGKCFAEGGWDVLSWSCRSCSPEPNLTHRMYDHGNITDLHSVVCHARQQKDYDQIVLVGFSMGGNIALKYVAETPPQNIKKVVAFSAPLDMRTSSAVLTRWYNFPYKQMFINKLMPKVKQKSRQFPDKITPQMLRAIRSWQDYQQLFFCAINDYPSLEDFYEKGSALHYLPKIAIPSLIVQAQNDPMLTPECSPRQLAATHPYVYLELPQKGGHCGFAAADGQPYSWAERRAFAFANGVF